VVVVSKVNQGNISSRFSVLMANYNNEEYIGEAIESVLNQSFTDWELIVIDDSSTDNSVAVIENYLNDGRIRFLKNRENIGYTKTLIRLVSKIRSDIFGTLDSDDALASNALEEMCLAHETNPQSGFIYSQYIYCDRDLKPISNGLSKVIPKGSTNLKQLYSGAFRTFKRSAYHQTGGFNPKFIYAQDRDIVFKMEEVTDVVFVDKLLYMHRVLLKGQSHDPNKKFLGQLFYILAKYDAFHRRLGTQIPNLTKKEMSIELCIASILSFGLRKGKDVTEYLRLAIDLNPILFFSMINFLFNKVITKIHQLFYSRKTKPLLIYVRVNEEISRQVAEVNSE
jgi:glycosyltransferase involved in cell wall biosynthesis